MHILEHLFLFGEFAERAHLLSGLTLEQVTLRPEGASHSIYEELWHLVGYQQSIIAPGGAPPDDLFPTTVPEHEDQWHELVQLFLTGARAAADLGQTPARLAEEVEVCINQFLPEPSSADLPWNQQILYQKRGNDHSYSVVHPSRGQELPHSCINDRVTGVKWGVRHMYYDRGVKEMLVYSPRTEDELKVAKRIVIESYRYASGDLETSI